MIDLRSDTVTRPTAAMRKAMAEAEVGDDVYREDPTVAKLEEQAAEIIGKESALFMPTGSMGNEVAVLVHTRPGEEVILDAECHILNYELGAMASFGGVLPRPIPGEKGFPTAEQVEEAIRSPIYYNCRALLLCLENTHNMQGGGIYPPERYRQAVEAAHRRGLKVHLDGARLFNASVASATPARQLAQGADSVMITLSKGLAAPAGSLLAGERSFIEEAVRMRKRMGGGMRQVGILAAAGIVALDCMVDRLAEDHLHARLLAQRLSEIPGIEIDPDTVETNIVIFQSTRIPAPHLTELLKRQGVLCLWTSPRRVRMVTHLDLSREAILAASEIVRKIVTGAA
jgi:threonine aldolase